MASSSCQLCAGLGCANCGGTGQIQIPDETDPGQWVFLADEEIVVKRVILNALIGDHCADCTFDSLEIHDCNNCDLKPIRAALEVGE